jgi:hypothetical protein
MQHGRRETASGRRASRALPWPPEALRLPASVGLLLFAFGAVACSNPGKQLEESRRAISSWKATLDALDQARSAGEVSKPFTRRTLETAEQELAKLSQKLEKTAQKMPEARSLVEQASALRERAARWRATVERPRERQSP